MQKIKDIFYDTNDLIVALLIIALAAMLIWSRIGVILDYPNTNAGGAYREGGGIITDGNAGPTTEDVAEAGDAAETGDAAEAGGETSADDNAATHPGVEPIKYSLYIAYGETAAQIAQKLLDSGLIKDNNEFYDALLAADAATRLQAGSFIITEGATPAEIVNILTGR